MVAHLEDCKNRALAAIDLNGHGLEIAPYFDAFIRKTDCGGRIMYTDYVSNEEIQAKSKLNPHGSSGEIPVIDFVWTPGVALKTCAPKGAEFDYVVASHVMEHVPNPIGWLNELLSVVKISGKIVLFLPDRNHTFDYFRNPTNFGELVSWWIEQPAVPNVTQVADFMSNSFSDDGTVIRDHKNVPQNFKRPYTDEDMINTTVFVYNEGGYIDAHTSVWETETVAEILGRVRDAGLLNVDISSAYKSGPEFLIVLTKLGEPLKIPPQRKHFVPVNATAPSGLLDVVRGEIERLKDKLKRIGKEAEL